MFCDVCDSFMDIIDKVIDNTESEITTEENNDKKKLHITNKLLDDIINENISDNSIFDNISIDDLYKNNYYNSLGEEKQNFLIDKIASKQKTNLNEDNYHYCSNCGNTKPIENKTCIYMDINTKQTNINTNAIMFDKTFAFTKKYDCINESCETHKNPSIKRATMYKTKGNYSIKYVCNVCNFIW